MTIVYGIWNKVSNKWYVGATSRWRIRRGQHKKSLQQNKHHSIKLQRAWNKYGEGAFHFLILEETDNTKLVEEAWIKRLNSYQNGYNCTPNGVGGAGQSKCSGNFGPSHLRGTKLSLSHRKKISEGVKKHRKPMSDGAKKRMSKLAQKRNSIKIMRNDGKKYYSLQEAAEDLGLKCSSALCRHLQGKNKTCRGFTFTKV